MPDHVIPAAIDEDVCDGELAQTHASRLATDKAMRTKAPAGALVLAADTVVACGRRILPKAETDEDVRACLRRLKGRRHRVVTAIALAKDGTLAARRVVYSRVAFRNLTDAEIELYVQCGEGRGKAGGYAIQGRAETFVRFINGSYSNVVGLPLAETVNLLRAHGFPC